MPKAKERIVFMFDRRNQYTREVSYRPVAVSILSLAAAALLIAGFLVPRSASAPDDAGHTAQTGADRAAALDEGCAMVQELTYARCGHSLTRRQTLPDELAGMTRAEAEAALAPQRVTSFSADEICLAQSLDMFCPEHLVLMPDESGMLCVFENRYGDAYALVESTDVPASSLPSAWQEDVLPGLPFDAAEDIGQWLENAVS